MERADVYRGTFRGLDGTDREFDGVVFRNDDGPMVASVSVDSEDRAERFPPKVGACVLDTDRHQFLILGAFIWGEPGTPSRPGTRIAKAYRVLKSNIHVHFGIEAMFLVDGGPLDPPPSHPMGVVHFDGVSLTSRSIAGWVDGRFAGRSGPRDHAGFAGSPVEISIRSNREDATKPLDTINLYFEGLMLCDMYRIACVAHDFVNISMGGRSPSVGLIPMELVAGAAMDDGHRHRVRLISQRDRFRVNYTLRELKRPMLDLSEVGGLPALAKLIDWCEDLSLIHI